MKRSYLAIILTLLLCSCSEGNKFSGPWKRDFDAGFKKDTVTIYVTDNMFIRNTKAREELRKGYVAITKAQKTYNYQPIGENTLKIDLGKEKGKLFAPKELNIHFVNNNEIEEEKDGVRKQYSKIMDNADETVAYLLEESSYEKSPLEAVAQTICQAIKNADPSILFDLMDKSIAPKLEKDLREPFTAWGKNEYAFIIKTYPKPKNKIDIVLIGYGTFILDELDGKYLIKRYWLFQ